MVYKHKVGKPLPREVKPAREASPPKEQVLDENGRPLTRRMLFVQQEILKRKLQEEAELSFKPQKFAKYKPVKS